MSPYRFHSFCDGVHEAPIADLTHPDEQTAANAIAAWNGENYTADVNCFGLADDDGLILIDAGTGAFWGPAYGKAPAAIAKAGFLPDHVGLVLLTHMHGDHALGLLDGDLARYPRANIVIPQAEFDYYHNPANVERTPANARGAFRTLNLLQAAYCDRVRVGFAGNMPSGVSAMPLPGHTPGHTGYLIEAGCIQGLNAPLLLWGDCTHVDTLQMADPDIGLGYDINIAQAIESRREAMNLAADHNWIVGGGHVRGLHRVRRRGYGFALTQENSRAIG